MFERYTEKARRIIFFARYEASQFGSPYIESEHLLLGLLREDKPLALRLLKTSDAIDSIRAHVEATTTKRSKVSTSVDLPLSHECKRILAYASEESERMNHKHIASAHLLAGILRESGCAGARMLAERQIALEDARALAGESRPDHSAAVSVRVKPAEVPLPLLALLEEREMAEDIRVATDVAVGGYPIEIAVYDGGDGAAALRWKIRNTAQRMKDAIATHRFDVAASCSLEERQLREELVQHRESKPLPPNPIPLLCIAIVGGESLTELRERVETYLRAAVAHVWVLDPADQRAYTVTASEGLREVTGDMLRIGHPKIEFERKRIFE